MMKILLLCAILTALCGAANAQYLDADQYRRDQDLRDSDAMWDSINRDYRMDQMQRQLDQQQYDAQAREHELKEQLFREQLNDNFGCDIHNHCR